MNTAQAIAGNVDIRSYRRLLVKAAPKIIETDAENARALAVIEKLILKGDDKRTPEEDALLGLLAALVEQFETQRWPTDASEPRELLRFLMEANDLRATDLADILSGRSRVSDILSGKRRISREQAKRLGERFRVSPALFL
jgi:HTH-type transcriptional regulator/antitoxin HigA